MTMAMLVVIQVALLSLVMAQEPFGDGNFSNGWWIQIRPGHRPPQPTTSCLLQSERIIKRDDYTYTPGIGGHKFHTQALTWNDARKVCEDEGGYLAIINSIAESQVIINLYNKSGVIVQGTGSTGYISVGFHDLFKEGEFLTIHGESVSRAGYNKWAPGQPDNAGAGEDCGTLHISGGLNDAKCDKTRGFICELPLAD